MKKNLFFAVMAIVALASCTSDDFVGENNNSPNPGNGPEKAIVFNSGTKKVTRADWTGQDAAEKLGEQFVFTGLKTDASSTKLVFDQYTAKWYDNTANSTLSNSNDWEYVGETPAATTSLPSGATQSIKYWDYSATQYDFAAYSTPGVTVVTSEGDVANGKVFIEPQDDSGTPGNADFMSYSITGSAADLQKCYISDLVTHYNINDNTNKANTFGQVVTFSFRSLAAKIRLAFFETVPGYSVKDVQFYDKADYPNFASGTADYTPLLLTADGSSFLPAQDGNGTMYISFPTNGWAKAPENAANTSAPKTDYNKAHIEFAPATPTTTPNPNLSSSLEFGHLDDFAGIEKKEDDGDYLGRTSIDATYAGGLEDDVDDPNYGKGKYYPILPNEDSEDLMIRIKYKLVSTDGSDEEIVVDNATAVIPKELAKWSPNYAYTYIFKISDLTNGTTGIDQVTGDPVNGLTPITLNAVVVDSEDGVQETITTVSDPSITTYMAGKVITTHDQYIANGKPIYIIVNDGSENVELTADNAKLYTVDVDEDYAINSISEETVKNALRYGEKSTSGSVTYTVEDAKGYEFEVTDVTPASWLVTSIAAADSPTGNEITLDASNNKAAKFEPSSNTIYVFEYLIRERQDGVFAAVAPAKLASSGTTYYTFDGSDQTYKEFTVSGDVIVDAENKYFTKSGDNYFPVKPEKLTKGETYYTSNNRGGKGKFVATGNEIVSAADKYYYATTTPDPGEYMYKIIKVQ